MKKLLLLLLLITGTVNAQIVNIPDADFKSFLLNNDSLSPPFIYDLFGHPIEIDSNGDGEIQVDEALNISEIYFTKDARNIKNLSGIEEFKNLRIMNIVNQNITSLDFGVMNYLTELSLGLPNLTNLELSHLPTLNSLYINGCTSLKSLIIKNGKNEEIIKLPITQTLTYICVDESQVDSIKNLLNDAAMTNTVVNSYCSFDLGGMYNTIIGNVRFDNNANGCDANDLIFSNLKIKINDGVNTGSTYENDLGDYKFYVQETNITLTPWLENPNFFTVTPSSVALNALAVNGITQTQDFCVTANGVNNDLEIVIMSLGSARPGFDAKYKIVYKNKGNQSLSGDINLTFDDTILDYVSANVNPDSQAEGNLKWNYTYLQPFETRSFTVTLNLNSPQEIPAVNDGDVLSLYVTINPVSGDELPNDNMFELNQTVVNSLDPNDITCLEGNTVSPTEIGDYLHYNINFENIGSASAINIVVKDIIDVEKFDVSTLQVLNMSHTMNTKITDNKVEFIFEDINLEAKEHGNVTYKIKTKSTLQTGDSVLSKADIFFDYNFPIATNDEITTFQALSNTEFVLDNSIRIYPNPANEFVNIKANDTIKSIQLYDFQGRIIKTSLIKDNQSKFDISTYSSGIYFIKVQTNEGIKVEKLMKK